MSADPDPQEALVRIRAAVQQARAMPMSSSAVVNRPQLLALLDDLAAAFPDPATTGHADAERVIAQAHQERDRLVSQTEVLASAQRRADELLSTAEREAEELRREADAYVDTTFAHLQVALTKTLEALNRGRERLSGRSELDALRPGADDAALPPLPS